MEEPTLTFAIEDVKNAILHNTAARSIEKYEKLLKIESDRQKKISLLLNLALAKLSLELTKNSIKDLQSIIQADPLNSIASFFLGVAHLWLSHEVDAITSWSKGTEHSGPISYFAVMKRLILDGNARTFLFSKKFDVLAVFQFVENFDNSQLFLDNEIQIAYNELQSASFSSAITHFNLILATDANNIDALKGRGTAECMTGQWKRAIDDLTIVINHGVTDNGQINKIRGVAYAALGQYTAAILDFSTAISQSSFDWEGRLERARLHMIMNSYQLALDDYTAVPLSKLNDQMLIDLAECYYAIGDVPRAAEIIMKVKTDNDHRKAYCHYLISRAVGRMQDASIQITHAVGLLPSFFLLRTVGDFMYDQARMQDASNYYRIALEQHKSDGETLRLYALALFQSGARKPALDIFQGLEEARKKQLDEVDLGLGVSDTIDLDRLTKNFHQSTPIEFILKAASNNFRYIIHLINNKDKSILEAARPSPSQESGLLYPLEPIADDFNFLSFKPTQQELDMIQDADRLGLECMPHAPEVIDNNIRIIRCLGFSVLCLAQQMKQKYFQDSSASWKDAIDLIRSIMSLADLNNSVMWTYTNNEQGIVVFPHLAPTYYIQRGERRSPRFAHAMQQAINRLRSGLSGKVGNEGQKHFETSLLVKLNTLDSIYSVAQTDLCHCGMWITPNNINLANPTVNLRYLGSNAYDLYVRPPLDPDSIKKYDSFCQETWTSLMEQNLTENTIYLPLMVMLIWTLHPLSHFSNETGHILFHSFLLASKNVEVNRLSSQQGELFMKQMTNPNFQTMKKAMHDHLIEGKLTPSVKPESLAYWSEMPTIAHLISLIDFIPSA